MARSKEVFVYGRRFCKVEASVETSVITRDTIICPDFSLIANSAADVKLIGHFNSLAVNGSSGCDIILEGETDYLNITANSASDIYGFDLIAKKCDVLASSVSDVRVKVIEDAHFNASSAANIIDKGSPPILDTRTSSMGDIRKARF